jgi:class 3 adenylate cyclase
MPAPFQDQLAALHAEAERLTGAGDWAGVRALARAMLSLDPDDAAATALLARADAAGTAAAEEGGERRQLTVMFVDMVGSTALSTAADPELVRDVVRAYQQAVGDAVAARGGHVAGYAGDGVIVYFGYPTAHEDDARRAVRAGLDVLDALESTAAEVRKRHDVTLSGRVAVHTGMVVRAEMGASGHVERDAVVGSPPNIAARLQAQADPGGLLISADTFELVGEAFVVDYVGELELRGVPEPIGAYRVLGEAPRPRRFRSAALAPFVGREAELARLWEGWDAARSGGRSLVLVRGEPGMGKSRLVDEFCNRLTAENVSPLWAGCSSFQTTTHLYPPRQLVEQACGIRPGDNPATVVDALRSALEPVGHPEWVPLFADLLGLPAGEGWAPPELAGPQLREVTLAALVHWLAISSGAAPVTIVVDDLQWADASTLELVERVVRDSGPGLCLVLTARQDFEPTWGQGILDPIELEPLSREELRQLAAGLPEAAGLDDADLDALVELSQGVPFFLEEMVRSAGKRAPSSTVVTDSRIPPALRDPLLARLSAPGVDLVLAQSMATVGRESDVEVLATLTASAESAVAMRLQRLVDSGLVEADERTGVFRFRHHLIGALAYDTQLIPERRRRHSMVADVLRARGGQGAPGDSGAIAYHLEHAARIPEAVDAYIGSARVSVERGGFDEAVTELGHALELVAEVTESHQRLSLELAVRQARGMASVTTLGYASPLAGEDFDRCFDISEALGPAPERIAPLTAIYYWSINRGELDRAEATFNLDRPRLATIPETVLPVEGGMAGIDFHRGNFATAIDNMHSYLASDYARAHAKTPPDYPMPDDPVVNLNGFLGLTLAITGRPGAEEAFATAERRAAGLDFPHRAYSNGMVGLTRILSHTFLGDHEGALPDVERVASLGEQHGLTFFILAAAMHRSFREAEVSRQIEVAEGGKGLWDLAGATVWDPWLYARLAEVRLTCGDAEGALADLVTAADKAARSGVHFWNAHIARVRGQARLAAQDDGGVGDLDEAVRVAHCQGARAFELECLVARCRASGPGAPLAALRVLRDDLVGAEIVDLGPASELLG